MLCGALMGVAMIIPGVSGGTVAVLLDLYDGLIESVSGLKRHFKESVLFLLPLIIGAAAAIAAMYFPILFAREHAPFPTVMLFAGLMAGSLPKLFKDSGRRGFKKINVLSVTLPVFIIIGICLVNRFFTAGDADLSPEMPVWGYFAVLGVAALASCAMVVPGVSGSMLLMILGYYYPILALVKNIFTSFWHTAAVFALFAAGFIIGIFTIAKLMKLFLEKYPRGTHWAIAGFVIGSVPAIFIVFDYAGAPMGAGQILAGVVACVLGAALTYALTCLYEKKHMVKD